MTKFAFYANTVSPHQLPLARELVRRLGADNYRYVFTDALSPERSAMGWEAASEPWIVPSSDAAAREWLRDADVVMMQHHRDWDLFEERLARGKACVYSSERWFKPRLGMARVLHPGYLGMARRFLRMLEGHDRLVYFPQGVHAAGDMARLRGLMHGDWRCLLKAPQLEFERKPGGRIFSRVEVENGRREKMRLWGYFVESGKRKVEDEKAERARPGIKVLWVGRLLELKRVDTIIRAVGELSCSSSSPLTTNDCRLTTTLDIYGAGPDEARLRRLAAQHGGVARFFPPVPIAEVRRLMRSHDVFVLASDGHEGWGATLSEALSEGMSCFGTFEAGASATMLPEERLFHAGDHRRLADLLAGAASLAPAGSSQWTASAAADGLLGCVDEIMAGGAG